MPDRSKKRYILHSASEFSDMITLKQIEAFVWATRLKSFAEAARRLNVTQSTLSKRIAELEAGLNGILFQRTGHKAVPTVLGRDIHELAEQMLDLREALQMCGDVERAPTGRVAFGLTELGAQLWLSDWVAAMRLEYPLVELEPYVDVSAPLIARLRAGKIDLAVLPLAPSDESLTVMEFAEVEFDLMASPSINPPLKLDRDMLGDWPILAQSGGSGLTDRFDAWALTHGLKLRRSLASNSLVAISELVLAGLGAAFLPIEPYRSHLQNGTLRSVAGPFPWPRLPYYLITRAGSSHRAVAALQSTIASSARTRARKL